MDFLSIKRVDDKSWFYCGIVWLRDLLGGDFIVVVMNVFIVCVWRGCCDNYRICMVVVVYLFDCGFWVGVFGRGLFVGRYFEGWYEDWFVV